MTTMKIFVSCAMGLQYILEKELQSFGIENTRAIPGGVDCEVDVAQCYRVLLWSRVASRVILTLASEKVSSADDVHRVSESLAWEEHFTVENKFMVRFSGTSAFVRNSTFGALRVKDGIVDRFRSQSGVRPSISKDEPDMFVHAHLSKGRLNLGLDLSGQSLHKRHYRTERGAAPLRENLAAGILMLSGWPEKFNQNSALIDPMCGSGTFLIEAAQLALDYAPAARREDWGFSHWLQHDSRLWDSLKAEADDRHHQTVKKYEGKIIGFDQDRHVIAKAWSNIQRAGLERFIHVEKRALSDFEHFEGSKSGLMIVNPPYGERLGELKSLGGLYKELGQVMEVHLEGWKAAVFSGNAELGRQLGWRSHKQYKLLNGSIESQLILVDVEAENRYKSEWMSPSERLQKPAQWKVSNAERAEMFSNRLKKNRKGLAKWLKKADVTCYRLYDADMPEFSMALDVYQDIRGQEWLYIQEYAAPSKIDEKIAAERLSEALAVIRDTQDIPVERIVLKSRMVQKGKEQYRKREDSREFFQVREGSALFRVNLKDYLDTGLFLDHRPVRRWIHDNASGERVLNLFSYTSAVTVQAALGGASESLSIDMSSTYQKWSKANFELNGLDVDRHRLLRADCLQWLREPVDGKLFDIIFLDPPSFSNSKSMEGILDVQRDHVEMIELAMRRLSKEGVLIFSNNLRKFKLAREIEAHYLVDDWNRQSLDKDFERNPRIHHCWSIRFK